MPRRRNPTFAAVAWEHFARGNFASLDLHITPGLVRKPRKDVLPA